MPRDQGMRKDEGCLTMEWEIKWENPTGEKGKSTGISKMHGDNALEVLNRFFKRKTNKNKHLVRLEAIYDDLKQYRRQRT